ncbi:hypothetical protein O6H91_02G090400 [Diphasiastrum complanatum]|uniref:Uncharacterized protein n=1 Tax=Diphasiastrum complanatum TaxID=34168 RepID=A0ACC2EIE8_DIPCM|nr:hypothetical protein O6H91_02G090400 [Diphasiastrum complanatum]
MSGRYMQFSPSAGGSPQLGRPSSASLEHETYLSELLAERQKLGPFMQVLPICSRLLNQGRSSPFLEHDVLDHGSPRTPGGLHSNGGGVGDYNSWGTVQPERLSLTQPSVLGWLGTTGSATPHIIKKTLRIEVPVDKFPNFNFVGRILGPRGNSLKRVEQTTGCRVMIRGRGSIKDTAKEEKMRDKPGYEHLNEPLHVLVEAELPSNVIDNHLNYAREILEDILKPPVDESFDVVKKAQLRELAILNGTLREESPSHMAMTPFDNPGMKRPKTRQ